MSTDINTSIDIQKTTKSKISQIDAYDATENFAIPTIELDLWFEFNIDSISFGRAFQSLSQVKRLWIAPIR